MKKILFFFLILILLVVGAIFYFFKSGPRDLGVKYTEADAKNGYVKNGVESASLPATSEIKNSISYVGQKEVKTSFTNAEITGLINSVKWSYMPVSNVQIKINPDGTGEASGVLDVNKILAWISFTHPVDVIKQKVDEYQIGFNPPFYLKGKVTVTNNQVSLVPQTIEVGRIAIPQNIVSENIRPIEKFASERISSIPNLNIRSLTLDGGQVNLDATMPEKELTTQN